MSVTAHQIFCSACNSLLLLAVRRCHTSFFGALVKLLLAALRVGRGCITSEAEQPAWVPASTAPPAA